MLLEFTAAWDRNGDGTVTAEEFLEYYADLSAGVPAEHSPVPIMDRTSGKRAQRSKEIFKPLKYQKHFFLQLVGSLSDFFHSRREKFSHNVNQLSPGVFHSFDK